MMTQRKWVALAVLFGAALLGSAVGTLGTLALVKQTQPEPKRLPQNERDMHRSPVEGVLNRLDRKLGLSEDQRAKVRVELERVGQRFQELHEKTSGEMKAILDEGADAISTHLTPEQEKIYRRHIEKLEKQRKRMIEKKHGSPKGPGGRQDLHRDEIGGGPPRPPE